ncbi:hypothetical protein CVT26_012602 [Gymnopilus dilepis]|uniref:Uncharacterized protein n=1 Tax=Gymnopilus dilepis TaxID=231916 RepID=A0A409WMX9_9AGAR|nr:hypothetical protein CVT26_012602 [Gymnopilus dilepis]
MSTHVGWDGADLAAAGFLAVAEAFAAAGFLAVAIGLKMCGGGESKGVEAPEGWARSGGQERAAGGERCGWS